MAGIKLGARTGSSSSGAVDPTADALVVTSAGSSAALPGTQAGTWKATPYAEYPAKGRATGGVRAHRFLKGEGHARSGVGRQHPGPCEQQQWCRHRVATCGRSS